MEFENKVLLTKDILPKDYIGQLEVIPTNPKYTINYRNKSVQDILQPISLESRKVLSLKHIEIVNYLKDLKPTTPIISIDIKNNYKNEYQLKLLIPSSDVNQTYLEDIINGLNKSLSINIISGYYQIKYIDKSKHIDKSKPTKFDINYHFYGSKKIEEEMDGNIIELCPNSFCRVNYHISKYLYNRVFILIKQITRDFTSKQNLICFGRDINFPIEYYHSHFQEILGLTHCPIVYRDCKPKQNLSLTLSGKNNYKKLFEQYFESKPKDKFIILVTSGRNGLERELWEFITSHRQVIDIVYIACGRKSLGRNMAENKSMELKHIIVMDEFPNTNSSNSIVHFRKPLNML